MRLHEASRCNGYCGSKEDEEVKRQKKRREYELMLIRRFNLKKEIRLLQRNFAANELNIKDYETDEETKESACEVRERVWENRAGKNWYSDTSFANEHLELGYYVLTQHERELAVLTLSDTVSAMEDNFNRLSKLGVSPTQNATL
ncbi:MAG: hypothetical protein M3261_04965 [Thermoproteota archaeon]|nr:hypothetical protein [Thermoproteota archaeon]